MPSEEYSIAELGRLMERLATDVDGVSKKIDTLKDEHIMQMIVAIGVNKEKVNRLENIVYGGIAVVTAQAVALIISFIKG